MPDFGPAVAGFAELFGPLIGRALGAFFRTAVGMATLSIVAAVASYSIAAEGSVVRGLVAVSIASVCFAVLGFALAIKRSIGVALLEGVAKVSLGSRTMQLLFERMLELNENDPHAQRGVDVARHAERVPLDQAETRLTAAVDWLLRVREGSPLGFFRRRLRALAVEKVSLVTLARFREEASRSGGVDLVKVRDELASRIDELIATLIRDALFKTTLVLVVACCAVSIGCAFGLRAIWK